MNLWGRILHWLGRNEPEPDYVEHSELKETSFDSQMGKEELIKFSTCILKSNKSPFYLLEREKPTYYYLNSKIFWNKSRQNDLLNEVSPEINDLIELAQQSELEYFSVLTYVKPIVESFNACCISTLNSSSIIQATNLFSTPWSLWTCVALAVCYNCAIEAIAYSRGAPKNNEIQKLFNRFSNRLSNQNNLPGDTIIFHKLLNELRALHTYLAGEKEKVETDVKDAHSLMVQTRVEWKSYFFPWKRKAYSRKLLEVKKKYQKAESLNNGLDKAIERLNSAIVELQGYDLLETIICKNSLSEEQINAIARFIAEPKTRGYSYYLLRLIIQKQSSFEWMPTIAPIMLKLLELYGQADFTKINFLLLIVLDIYSFFAATLPKMDEIEAILSNKTNNSVKDNCRKFLMFLNTIIIPERAVIIKSIGPNITYRENCILFRNKEIQDKWRSTAIDTMADKLEMIFLLASDFQAVPNNNITTTSIKSE